MGWLSLIILILLTADTLVAINAQKQEDGYSCKVSDLEPGRVLQCTDKTHHDVFFNINVPNGSSCDIICPNKPVKTRAYCEQGSWNKNYLTYCRSVVNTIKKRQKRFFLFALLASVFVASSGSLAGSTRDNNPPRLICPPNQNVIAVKLQTWQIVNWTEPVASDNIDGRIRATRYGKKSGSYFFSGDTTVGYFARDNSENMARCTFVITVTVVRCPWLSPLENGYFMCHPSDDARYGATCRFGCYPGYELIGNSALECMFTGKWDAVAPICKKKTCPPLLPSVLPMNYICTDGNKFRSICTYSCTSGYDIKPGMSRVRVCTAFGKWRGSEPTCRDIEPPTIIGCRKTVHAYAVRNTTSGFITWDEPTATDNHDSSVEVVKEGNVSPGDTISAGSYKLIYKAEDSAGNKAQTCKTHIILKVLTCPAVYPTPFLQVTCPWGTKYGSQCEFKCDPGSERNGSKIIVCEKSESGLYGYWTGGETQTYCKVTKKCDQEPNIPQNGALVCDNWVGGKVCQMLCKKGFDVKVGYKSVDMLVCGNNGKWLPTGSLPLPDCAKSFLAARGILSMSISYYYTGDCTNLAVQEEMKRKFIDNLSKSAYKDMCLVYATDCNVENVQVKCGLSTRKKRSDSNIFRIDFDIEGKFENESFVDSFAKFRNHQTNLSLKIKDAQMSRSLDFNTSEGRFMEAMAVDNYDVKLDCPDNTIPSYKTTACVECAAGTFYDKKTDTCQMCPKGQYQPEAGKTKCLSCPPGQTTKTKGSQQPTQCEDGCYPGSWSADGTPECSLCAVGSYSDVYGASECIFCPGSTSTTEEGTDSVAKCNDFDLGLTESDSETSVNFTVTGMEDTSISFWLQMEDYVNGSFNVEIISTEERTVIFYMSLGSETILGKGGEKKKTQFILSTPRWQSYFIGMKNGSSELYVNGILNTKVDMTFNLSGSLTMYLRGKAMLTKLNIWTNTGTSFSNILSNVQNCSAEETGSVFSWKSLETNTNDKIYKQMPSECDDENNCSLDSCFNGKCTDLMGRYECQCDFGFIGDNCEENIDDCVDHACENNATCVDGVANYTCNCLYGYKGELCEIAMVDGSWSEWGEWSSCSVTCGNGTQQRRRVCNDPAPDNGGLECPDNSTDSRPCIQNVCPECSTLERHEHQEWTCTNDTENMNCTIECADGYDFDHEIKPFYMCGKDTFYLWDFQTDDNPDGKMPMCNKIEDSEKLQVFYQATYKDLECNSAEMYENAHRRVSDVVQQKVNRIDCVTLRICIVDKVDIIDCSKRQRRSITTPTAGINVSLSCDPALYDTDTCYKMLYSAINGIHELTVNRSFDVDIRDTTYELNSSSPQAYGSVQCPNGMVPIRYYCVPCSVGRYLRNDECVKCEYGTYQDNTGQTHCKKCPDHTTTPGRESREISECSVKLDNNDVDDYVFFLGCIIGGSVCIVAVISIVALRRCLKRTGIKKDGALFTASKNKIGLAHSKKTTGRKCSTANSSFSEGKFRENSPRSMSPMDTPKLHTGSSIHDIQNKSYEGDEEIDIIDL